MLPGTMSVVVWGAARSTLHTDFARRASQTPPTSGIRPHLYARPERELQPFVLRVAKSVALRPYAMGRRA
eukprot:1216139-Alexandrium_andersonii.AAC.1